MDYFKHTNGEAFTLESSDYIGYFHIIDGKAFTGKKHDNESLLLSSKNNIITEIFTNSEYINTNYSLIDKLIPSYTNSLDVIDKNGLDALGNRVDANNIKCFKNLILANPTVYKFEENNGFYYGLSSINESNPSYIPIKSNYRGNCEKFNASEDWKALDTIHTGVISVDSFDNFKYLCSNGETTYTFTGNFTSKTPLILEKTFSNIEYVPGSRGYEYPDYVYTIYQDFANNKIFFVKSSTIEIHDATTFPECDSTTLIDIIALKKSKITFVKWNTPDVKFTNPLVKWDTKYLIDNPNSPEFIKFGYNNRTELDKFDNILYLKNKYSSDTTHEIKLNNYNILNIVDLDISPINDYIIILHQDLSGELRLSQFDPYDLTTIKHNDILSVNLSANNKKIKFSDYDSDVFILTNQYEYQTRYLSNPEYPTGRLETCDLMYYTPKVWNKTLELWEYMYHPWNRKLDYSNIYYNLLNSTIIKNNKMYMLLHNVGRIYAISQPMNDRFLTPVPLDLPKNFQNVECSESSIGLQLNSIFRNLTDDTLSILRNSKNTFQITEKDVILKKLQDYSAIIENMYINGNETINVLTFQRILISIFELQQRLIPTSTYIPHKSIEISDNPTINTVIDIGNGLSTTTTTTTLSTLSGTVITTSTETVIISSGEVSTSTSPPLIISPPIITPSVDKSITTKSWTTRVTPYLPLYPQKNSTGGYKSGYDASKNYEESTISTGYTEIDAYSPELNENVEYEVRNWGSTGGQGYAFWSEKTPIITANYDDVNKSVSWSNMNPSITLVRGKFYTFDLNFVDIYEPMIIVTTLYDENGDIPLYPAKYSYFPGIGVVGDKITQWPPLPPGRQTSTSTLGIPNSFKTIGTITGKLFITVPIHAPDKLYYVGLSNPKNVNGEILIVNP